MRLKTVAWLRRRRWITCPHRHVTDKSYPRGLCFDCEQFIR